MLCTALKDFSCKRVYAGKLHVLQKTGYVENSGSNKNKD